MDWLITGISIVGKVLGVRKMRATWLISAANQILWVVLCIDKELWGLIPLSMVHMALAFWGWMRWTRDDNALL